MVGPILNIFLIFSYRSVDSRGWRWKHGTFNSPSSHIFFNQSPIKLRAQETERARSKSIGIWMRNPPTLLSLAIDSAVLNFSRISDLSFVPDHILLDLFQVLCMIRPDFVYPRCVFWYSEEIKFWSFWGFFWMEVFWMLVLCVNLGLIVCFEYLLGF